jgi:HSP20 family protein
MATNRGWDPFSEMLSLRDAMSQLMEGSVVRPGTYVGGTAASQTFPLNVHGTADELKVEALLPGVSEEDVQVDIDRGVLTIAAKRHGPTQVQGHKWYLQEFHGGEFSRSLSLPFPVEVEHASASFSNGVLTLTLPKAAAARPRRIQIGGGLHEHQQLEGSQHEGQQVIEGQAAQKQQDGTTNARRTKRDNG